MEAGTRDPGSMCPSGHDGEDLIENTWIRSWFLRTDGGQVKGRKAAPVLCTKGLVAERVWNRAWALGEG